MSKKNPAQPLQWFTTKHKTEHCHLNNETWATVRDCGSHVKLIRWFKGCGLAPHETVRTSVQQAKADAEAWLSTQ